MPEPIALYSFRAGSSEEAEHRQTNEPIELDPEQLQQLDDFDNCLYSSLLPSVEFVQTRQFLESNEVPAIEEVWRLRDDVGEFITEYFATPEGREKFAEIVDDSLTDSVGDHTEIGQRLSRVDWSDIKKADFDRLSKASINWAKQRFVEQFAARNYQHTEGMDEPKWISIVRNPGELTDKIGGYSQIKKYLIAVRKDLRQMDQSEPLIEAMQVIAKIYVWRLNYALTHLLPKAYDLAAQYQVGYVESIKEQLEAISTAIGFNLLDLPSEKELVYKLRSIDWYCHGVAYPDGKLTPISSEIETVFKPQATNTANGEYWFKDYDVNELKKMKIESEQVKEMYEYLLDYYGMLSEDEAEIDIDRTHRAGDNKWQVVLDPKRHTLEVSSKKGLILVPESRTRNVVKEFTVACHEFAHIVQAENKRRITSFRLVHNVGSSRNLVYSEGGGISWEKAALAELFGLDRPPRSGYLRAAQILLKGDGWVEAAAAYFSATVEQGSNNNYNGKAKAAFVNVKRLFRQGGQWRNGFAVLSNSQPLNYAEQEIVAEQLGEEQLLSGISPYVAEDLARIGLLNKSKMWIPNPKPWEVLAPYLERKLQDGAYNTNETEE